MSNFPTHFDVWYPEHFYETVLGWILQACIDDNYKLSQVMAWRHQAPWPSSVMPYASELIKSLRLTGWVMHICIVNLTIIDLDNGLTPTRRQAIIWTNAGILLIGPQKQTSVVSTEIHKFSFKKMHLKIWSAKKRPFVSASVYQLSVFACVVWYYEKYRFPSFQ